MDQEPTNIPEARFDRTRLVNIEDRVDQVLAYILDQIPPNVWSRLEQQAGHISPNESKLRKPIGVGSLGPVRHQQGQIDFAISPGRLDTINFHLNSDMYHNMLERLATYVGIDTTQLNQLTTLKPLASIFEAIQSNQKLILDFIDRHAPDRFWRRHLSEGETGLSGPRGIHKLSLQLDKPQDPETYDHLANRYGVSAPEQRALAIQTLNFLHNQRYIATGTDKSIINVYINFISQKYDIDPSHLVPESAHTFNWGEHPDMLNPKQTRVTAWPSLDTNPRLLHIRQLRTDHTGHVTGYRDLTLDQVFELATVIKSASPDEYVQFTNNTPPVLAHNPPFLSFSRVHESIKNQHRLHAKQTNPTPTEFHRDICNQGKYGSHIEFHTNNRDELTGLILHTSHTNQDGLENLANITSIAKALGNEKESSHKEPFQFTYSDFPVDIEVTPPLVEPDSDTLSQLFGFDEVIIRTALPNIKIKSDSQKIDVSQGLRYLKSQLIPAESAQIIDDVLDEYEFNTAEEKQSVVKHLQSILFASPKSTFASAVAHSVDRFGRRQAALQCVSPLPTGSEGYNKSRLSPRLGLSPGPGPGIAQELIGLSDLTTGQPLTESVSLLINKSHKLSPEKRLQFQQTLLETQARYHDQITGVRLYMGSILAVLEAVSGTGKVRQVVEGIGNLNPTLKTALSGSTTQCSSLGRSEYGISEFNTANTSNGDMTTGVAAMDEVRRTRSKVTNKDLSQAIANLNSRLSFLPKPLQAEIGQLFIISPDKQTSALQQLLSEQPSIGFSLLERLKHQVITNKIDEAIFHTKLEALANLLPLVVNPQESDMPITDSITQVEVSWHPDFQVSNTTQWSTV